MKKDIKFSTRMTSENRTKIKALAAKSGMSMSDYVTACCLGKQILVIDEQKELLRQLKGIGSNLNRLTVLANMGKVQIISLDNAARYVRPGGTLVYSTCTILPEENEQVTQAFQAEHTDFTLAPFELPQPVGKTDGSLTLWPQRHDTDGFYICRMTRR